MKRPILLPLFFIFFAALAVVGCQESEAERAKENPLLTVRPAALNEPIAAAGGDCTVELTSNSAWAVADKTDGLTVTPDKGGAGTHTLTVAVPANASVVARAFKLVFKTHTTEAVEQLWGARQAGAKLSVALNSSGPTEAVPWRGKTYTVELTTNSKWKANGTNGVWSVSPQSGEAGTHSVTVVISKNTTPSVRYLSVVFSALGVVEEETVRWNADQEEGTAIKVTPSGVYTDVPSSGGSFTIEVLAAEGWHLRKTNPNLTITPESGGFGSTTVTATWLPRTDNEPTVLSENLLFQASASTVSLTTTQSAKGSN